MAYSKHLDWHFRMKKRKAASQKSSAKSRKWFLELDIWFISNEIEDEKSTSEEVVKEESEEIPTVPKAETSEFNRCPVCREDFDVVFLQEGENNLYLHNAMRPENVVESQAYHPGCFNDRDNIDDSIAFDESMEVDQSIENEKDQSPEQKLNEETTEDIKQEIDTEAIKTEDEPMETATQVASEATEATEPPTEATETEVKEEPQDETAPEAEEEKSEPNLDDSGNLGNLTADIKQVAPSFDLTKFTINITSQV